MIERTNAFKVGDQSFLTLVDAQKHELVTLLRGENNSNLGGDWSLDGIVSWLLDNKSKVVDILTITPTSKVRARKVHGGTKKRSPNVPVPASLDLPGAT